MARSHLMQSLRGLWRRIFSYRLRELLLLITVVALCAAWWSDHRRLTADLEWKHAIGKAWSVGQATGPPDTNEAGDKKTAWASATPDGQQEWLMLSYAAAVEPVAIVVHETYNPGAVYRVTSVSETGFEETIWQGNDPTPPSSASGVSRLPISVGRKISRIKLYLDSPTVAGWNEVDAVGLVRSDGTIEWANRASASSSYAGSFSGNYLLRVN